ncbi:hypothetical protein P153DRAFT_389322 [Dothidotthia symphoricarpi CBS 119687]|uniref:Uncharacterized protein n=1 Tax=Dothidotthia symphoricarpi CBS 119687 TaxID=1392245 RepID=A0A6A6A5I8_9PLEO|nr:uncharacterized protein P153DRAFT_389322 [Dothidotthia symphoricarpi CBS 119687]KAF2125871.1 hypothetical protein P153DRAFT_389322 [Dothidotthia symphoricarpi CBS 119687]
MVSPRAANLARNGRSFDSCLSRSLLPFASVPLPHHQDLCRRREVAHRQSTACIAHRRLACLESVPARAKRRPSPPNTGAIVAHRVPPPVPRHDTQHRPRLVTASDYCAPCRLHSCPPVRSGKLGRIANAGLTTASWCTPSPTQLVDTGVHSFLDIHSLAFAPLHPLTGLSTRLPPLVRSFCIQLPTLT